MQSSTFKGRRWIPNISLSGSYLKSNNILVIVIVNKSRDKVETAVGRTPHLVGVIFHIFKLLLFHTHRHTHEYAHIGTHRQARKHIYQWIPARPYEKQYSLQTLQKN